MCSNYASPLSARMRTPVVLIIFNRPDLTARVFAEIARARPEKLLVIADGPRPDREGEDAKCAGDPGYRGSRRLAM